MSSVQQGEYADLELIDLPDDIETVFLRRQGGTDRRAHVFEDCDRLQTAISYRTSPRDSLWTDWIVCPFCAQRLDPEGRL